MGVSFLSPWAAAVAALALAAVLVLLASERRSRRLCKVLGIAPRRASSVALDAGGLLAVGLLLGLAAAQPVVSRIQSGNGRTDAEVIAVVDVTRSMLARPTRTGTMRLDRARAAAKELRAGVAEVPVGVSSLTDRLLPHLFPTLSTTAFTSTIDRAIAIERPPPERRSNRATALAALGDLGRQNFFGERARTRVAVIFTDGESLPFNLGELRALLVGGKVATVFVHVWHPDDRVYGRRGDLESYRPDPISSAVLQRLAREVGGQVFTEQQVGQALQTVQQRLGTGPVAEGGRELRAVSLAPYAVLAAVFPLGFVLLRRNF